MAVSTDFTFIPVHAGNSDSLQMLATAYQRLYVPLFPFEEEREPLDAWTDGIKNPDPDIKYASVVVTTTQQDVIGMGVGKYFTNPDVGYISCIAVDPKARGRSIGQNLMRSMCADIYRHAEHAHKPLAGIFFETNDPSKVNAADDSMDPARRLRLYELWGYQKIDIPYAQPPMEPGQPFCDKMLLMVCPHPITKTMPKPNAIKGFLDIIYADPAYAAEKAQICLHVDRLALYQWRSTNGTPKNQKRLAS